MSSAGILVVVFYLIINLLGGSFVGAEEGTCLVDLVASSRCCKTTFEMIQNMTNSIDQLNNKVNEMTQTLEKYGRNLTRQEQQINEIHQTVFNRPRDCSDVRKSGHSESGVYRIFVPAYPNGFQMDVYCDMDTANQSWLVFQRRMNGAVNFERTWSEYSSGFGSPFGEFWLGNDILNMLTSSTDYKLRFDLEDFDGQKRFAEYSTFIVGSSSDYYRMTVSGYTGDAGDSLAYSNGQQFSTKDVDRDQWASSCAQTFRGAWWYNACHYSNLNGLYLRGNHSTFADGVEWYHFRGYYYSLKFTEMKIARKN